MKKEYVQYILISLMIIFIILLIILIYINFFKKNSNSQDEILKTKVSEEINYLDFNTINLLNKLNNITVLRYKVYTQEVNTQKASESNNYQQSQSSQGNQTGSSQISSSSSGNSADSSTASSTSNASLSSGSSSKGSGSTSNASNGSSTISQMLPNSSLINTDYSSIDWTSLSFSLESVYSTWPTINLDLQKLGLTEDQTNIYSNALNGAMQSVEAKDKNSSLINLYNMYLQLVDYETYTTNDQYKLNIINTKSDVLNAYLLSNNDKWKEMDASISKAKDTFSQILGTGNDKQQSELQKTYIVINELKNSIVLNDKNIFFINYKNAMEQLETI